MMHSFTADQALIVSELPPAERPREKLIQSGPQALSDTELLAVIIGSGTSRNRVGLIAEELMALFDKAKGQANTEDLQRVKGVGAAKASTIAASIEFARRHLCPSHRKINRPADVLPIVDHYADRRQEHFLCLALNGAHEVMSVRVVSLGLVNRTIVHPREVYADPLQERAAAVIVAHNHPSGNVEPSEEDRVITKRLKEAGEILGIGLLDHIVFSPSSYYSFLEHKQI